MQKKGVSSSIWLRKPGVGRYYPRSKVEVTGFWAKYYDVLLDIITLNKYRNFIKEVIRFMQIKREDRILDLGCGTGRNTCLMRNYLSNRGSIIGVDISEIMIKQFKKKCSIFTNVYAVYSRADRTLPFKGNLFDKILISFMIHGFPHNVRESILDEARRVLKNRGRLFILDYNKFEFGTLPFYIKLPFKYMECIYAFDFIRRDWLKILSDKGFAYSKQRLFFSDYIRILEAYRSN